MRHSAASALNSIGLYRPLMKSLRILADSQYRRNQWEVWLDLQKTRRDIGAWAALGAENADPGRLFGIVSFTNLPHLAKFHCLVAKAMQFQGYTPVIFTISGNRFGHQYFRLFGVDRIVMWDEFVKENISRDQVMHALESMPTPEREVRQIMPLNINGVAVGKHALSATARLRVEGRLDLNDSETWKLFEQEFYKAVHSVLAADLFMDRNPIEKMLVRDAGYIPNGAIYESALNRGTDCVVYDQGQKLHTWIFKRYKPETKGRHYFSLSDASWEKIKKQPWTSRDDARLEKEFKARYKPDSEDDTRRLMAGKQNKNPDVVRRELGLDIKKKTAVIFSHMAWDAAFFYGTCLFDDYENWLLKTVEFAIEEGSQLNWIVKLHPANMFKLQRENIVAESEMRLLSALMPLPEHIKIMRADTDISTQSLFPIVDYVLTVNGTVGMEFPCFGVPTILAGTGRYEGRGFTIEPATQKAYFELLRRLHKIPSLSQDQKILARKHFYHLITRRQYSLEEIAPMQLKKFHEAKSNVHDNIHITARSLDDLKSANSLQKLGNWIAHRNDLDLLEELS